ncbi:MAG: M23 family metallopeptidase [Bacteroidota bacterium]
MKLYNYLAILFLLFLLSAMVYVAAGGNDILGDVAQLWKRWTHPTPRTQWLRQAKQDGIEQLDLWEASYEKAAGEKLVITLPHREKIKHSGENGRTAHAFRIDLPAGRQLRIRCEKINDLRIFGALYGERKLGYPLAFWEADQWELTYENRWAKGQTVRFLVQTPPQASVEFALEFTTSPILTFPVQGRSEKSIQSFWGDPRDGGRRKHEGNDVFAPKGTPLLAVVNGRVDRVKEGGIGGKVVWLSDGEGRGLDYYYAHLDEQMVSVGDLVNRGEVIGTVGNTGNAQFTPPHLHFGIYDGAAMDPFEFIRDADGAAKPPQLSLDKVPAKVPGRGNHYLRITPSREGEVMRQLQNGEAVSIVGATGRFYRLMTSAGEVGYANFD